MAAPQAPPRSATAEPVPTEGFGEDETESLVIEIGRIELIPPTPSAPAPLRRERLVTLSSYLADRREGRR